MSSRATSPNAPAVTSEDLIAALRTVPFGSGDVGSSRHLPMSPAVQAAVNPVVAAARWGAIAYGMIFGVQRALEGSYSVVVSLSVCLFITTWRSVIPLALGATGGTARLAGCLDALLVGVAVGISGGPLSPFIYCLGVAMVVAAFGWGWALGAIAVATGWLGLGIGLQFAAETDDRLAADTVGLVAFGTVALCAAAAFARDRFIAAEEQREVLSGQLTRLSEANDLLTMLNSVARSLPTSLSEREVLDNARRQIADTFSPVVLCVFEYDEFDDEWIPKLAEGASVRTSVTTHDLPAHLRQAADGHEPWLVSDLTVGNVRGIDERSGSGIYTRLVSRGRTVGLLGIEARTPGTYTERDRLLLSGMADILALTLDNARLFGRLRALGAEEERIRIARDLHDRLGQWLTYISFELERHLDTEEGDHPQLRQLHGDVQTALDELRETLRQLRSTITEERSLAVVAREHVQRFADRTGIEVTFRASPEDGQLPVPVENELLRILQEALNNIDKHAKATHVAVTWTIDGGTGTLRIVDNGRGFNLERGVRESAYGLVGMRERADVIGGRLSIESAIDRGTTVNVTVGAVPAKKEG